MTEPELMKVARARSLARSGAARTIRTDAGLGLRECAEVLQVAPSTLHRWEAGERVPRGEAALRYAELLNRLLVGERSAS